MDRDTEEINEIDNALRVKVLQCIFEGISWRIRAETECGQLLYIIHENPLSVGDRIHHLAFRLYSLSV